jgi:hypothetical protein
MIDLTLIFSFHLTVKGPDGPIAVTPLLFVGFNQSCADPCCMPTSTVINWGTVNLGFTMADFWAGVVNIAFDALIEIAIDQSLQILIRKNEYPKRN